MKLETKRFIKKLLLVDLILLGVFILVLIFLVVPKCSSGNDCYARGERLGYGFGQLFFSGNFLAVIVYYFRHRKK